MPTTTGTRGVSRRTFFRVVTVAGGGIALAVGLPPLIRRARGAGADSESGSPDLYIQIAPNNTVTITVPRSEMGQGVRTSLAMLVAEELDADWNGIEVRTAGFDPRYGSQGTGGSSSVRSTFTPLRTAGATLRAMLVAEAAEMWGVPVDECTTVGSTVLHTSGKKLKYGDVAAGAALRSVPTGVSLKPQSDWTVLGTDRSAVDLTDILHGRATYGLDVKVPGMAYAAIARTRVFGGGVKSFDPTAALAVPGVQKVVEVPAVANGIHVHAGVAVIADNTWAALEGRKALQVEWDVETRSGESSEGYRDQMQGTLALPCDETVFSVGDADATLGEAQETLSAEYEFPFLSHATMEPQNCTAHVEGDRVEIWSPTQFPDWASQAVAETLNLKVTNVTTHVTLMGGGFGRRINPDFTVEAALVSQKIQAPVKVVWTREDDLGHDFYRPCAMHRVDAALGTDGLPVAWRQRFTTPSISATNGGETPKGGWGRGETDGGANMLYRIPNRKWEYTLLDSGVPRGWWRAVHTTHNTFVVETMMDELAARAGQDPVAFRLALIDQLPADAPSQSRQFPFDPERLKGVLRLAAEKAGWGRSLPAGSGMGIACGIDHLSYAAVVIEVSVVNDRLKVERAVCAVDCGPVLNPVGARAQIEGGVTQGLSAALKERITIAGGAVEQQNFDTYHLIRMREVPPIIEAHFIETDTHPTGLGEPSVPPTPPALANAIAAATGRRYRTLPLAIRTA